MLEIRHDHYIHFVHDSAVAGRLDSIDHTLRELTGKVHKMASTLDDVLAKVTEEDTAIDSLIALTTGIEQQLKDALSGTTLPPAVQAKVDAVFAGISKDVDKVNAALAANVPPAS